MPRSLNLLDSFFFASSVYQANVTTTQQEVIGDSPPLPQISPLTGPREGGTRVTIEGENLGLQVKEITHVQVAGVRCSAVPSQYISAERSAGIRVCA